MWQNYFALYGAPFNVINAFSFYGDYFAYPEIQSRPLNERPINPSTGTEIFYEYIHAIASIDEYFLLTQVNEIQNQINLKLSKANNI